MNENIEDIVMKAVINKGMTIATAESCTSWCQKRNS